MDAIADCVRARALDPTYYRAVTRLAALLLVRVLGFLHMGQLSTFAV